MCICVHMYLHTYVHRQEYTHTYTCTQAWLPSWFFQKDLFCQFICFIIDNQVHYSWYKGRAYSKHSTNWWFEKIHGKASLQEDLLNVLQGPDISKGLILSGSWEAIRNAQPRNSFWNSQPQNRTVLPICQKVKAWLRGQSPLLFPTSQSHMNESIWRMEMTRGTLACQRTCQTFRLAC